MTSSCGFIVLILSFLDRLAALPLDDAKRTDMGPDGLPLAVPHQTGDSVIPLSPD
jgi:hypothetical protein